MRFQIPPWVARPAAVLSTLAAMAGSVLVFLAAATGRYSWAIWGGVAFVAAALLWYAGDLSAAPDHSGPS